MISDCSDNDLPDIGPLESCDIYRESKSNQIAKQKLIMKKYEPNHVICKQSSVTVARKLYDNIRLLKSGNNDMKLYSDTISFCKSLKKEKIMKKTVYTMDILTLNEVINSGRIRDDLIVVWPPCNDDFSKMEENEFLYIIIGESDLDDLDSFCNNFHFYLNSCQYPTFKLAKITVIQLLDQDHIINAVEESIKDYPDL